MAEHLSVSTAAPVPADSHQEVAVVRHPIADARHVVVGYELRFGGAVDLGDPAMDDKATSALLVEVHFGVEGRQFRCHVLVFWPEDAGTGLLQGVDRILSVVA